MMCPFSEHAGRRHTNNECGKRRRPGSCGPLSCLLRQSLLTQGLYKLVNTHPAISGICDVEEGVRIERALPLQQFVDRRVREGLIFAERHDALAIRLQPEFEGVLHAALFKTDLNFRQAEI